MSAPERIALRAGMMSMMYEAGALRYIRLGQHDVVRMIYAAVRDQNWGTVPAELRDVQMEIRDDSFDITFVSDHHQDDIHFVWRGTIKGGANGTIEFTFDGEVLTSFKRNRIGFCVLHPMDIAGTACEVEHVDGQVTQGTFPQYIAPHQPYFDIRVLTHEVLDGVRAEVRMEGDTFEMEDQRNWSDASFKTYCTPLGLPFPMQLAQGDTIQQCITVRLIGQPPEITVKETTPTLYVDDSRALPLPPIGLCVASHGDPLTTDEIERLRALNLAHLRLDLHVDENSEKKLRQAADEANALGCALEIALHLGQDIETDLQRIRALVDVIKPQIARWLIFRNGDKSTRRETVIAARRALERYGAAIGGGTDAYFTELNRERPPTDLLDWVCFSINPQVHAFDNASLIETIEAQTSNIDSARQFSGDAKIAVTPVTFKMRWNPDATAPEPETRADVMPRRADLRQMSPFGAVWTLGSINALVSADSLTFYETTGWLGVMEREGHSLYPLYQVLADVGEFAGGEHVYTRSSDPLGFGALALRNNNTLHLLVANYTSEKQQVTLSGHFAQKPPLELLPYAVVRIDQLL